MSLAAPAEQTPEYKIELDTSPRVRTSAWSPLRHRTFAVLWTATLIANVGIWMRDVGAGWLMTTLAPSPMMVALVQAATTLPVLLFSVPAGALADIVDRRRLLLVTQVLMGLLATALGISVLSGHITAAGLLAFTFLLGIGVAVTTPAWMAILPGLVPREEFAAAIPLNGVAINISRAIGPALGGLIIVAAGLAWPFLVNAVTFLALIAALLWWRPHPAPARQLPAERLWNAMRAGIRYTRSSTALKAALARAVMFFVFASAYWALLPLIARERLQGGAQLYGILVATIGAGAVIGASGLARLRKRMSLDRIMALGTLGTAIAMTTFALVRAPGVAIAGSLLAGASWIAVLSSIYISAQASLPDWVRARGLAIFNTVFFGSMALGSVLWGQAAERFGIPAALLLASVCALLGLALTRRFHLQGGMPNLSPSRHWQEPLVAGPVEPDHGPVMITVEYQIDPSRAPEFLSAIRELERARRRGGATAWGVFRDIARPGRYLQYFLERSWVDHLRHHERVTEADREIQARVEAFHIGPEPPRITHFLAATHDEPG